MKKPLPCPFCGGRTTKLKYPPNKRYCLRCKEFVEEKTMEPDTRSIEHMIETMKAFEEDGIVECRERDCRVKRAWSRTNNPHWSWNTCEYRPIPKPREWDAHVIDGRLVGPWIPCQERCGECVHVREVLEDSE